MAKRAASICSNKELLIIELAYIEKVFIDINNYPPNLVHKIISTEKEKYGEIVITNSATNANPANNVKYVVSLCLPYNGSKGEHLINKLRKDLNNKLPKSINTQIVYKATKLQSKFQVKDKIHFNNKHNITYLGTCDCGHRYIGQTKCRCQKRIIEHNKSDKQSHLLKHSNTTKHRRVWLPDFKILGSGYSSDFKRKISESLYIKQYKPEINIQKDAYKLKLFN